jgi:hypothetical protein
MSSGKDQNGKGFGAAQAKKRCSTGEKTPTLSAGQQNVEEKAAGAVSLHIRAEKPSARAALQAAPTGVAFRAVPARVVPRAALVRVVRPAAVAKVADRVEVPGVAARAEDSAGSGLAELC